MVNRFVQATGEAVAPVDEAMGGEPDALFGVDADALSLRGPAIPTGEQVPIAADSPQRPFVEITSAPDLVVVGLHGGAGTSTLVRLLTEAGDGSVLDAGTQWPVFAGWQRPAPTIPVVAVARTHYAGLDEVTRLAGQWTSEALPGGQLIGVVLVDDAPKLATAQQTAARRALRMTPHGWHVPWQETWRLAAPALPSLPRRVRDIIRDVRRQAERITEGASA